MNSWLNDTEKWISDLEDRMMEITAVEQNKEKRMKRNEDSLRDLWDNIKCTNIHIIGILEEVKEMEEKGPEKIFEEIIEGSGTPLQYSCLANPMDGGAW